MFVKQGPRLPDHERLRTIGTREPTVVGIGQSVGCPTLDRVARLEGSLEAAQKKTAPR